MNSVNPFELLLKYRSDFLSLFHFPFFRPFYFQHLFRQCVLHPL
jgi:hypothetical protein